MPRLGRAQPFAPKTRRPPVVGAGVATSTYDLTNAAIGGIYVQVEGGATKATYFSATAWGAGGSPAWNDCAVRFKGTVGTIAVQAYLNGGPVRLAIDGVDQGSVTTLANSSAYDSGFTTIATGLDSAAEHTYLISFGQGMYLKQIQTTGGTGINTARLQARPVLLGYGDSITAGDSAGGTDSTVSWLHKAGLSLGYQVVNRGVHSSQVATDGQTRTTDVTGQIPAASVVVILYGTNDVVAGEGAGVFDAAYLDMLQKVQAGNPGAYVISERLLKTTGGDTSRDAYSAIISTQVSAMGNAKFTYKAGMYGAYDGSTGVHPDGTQCTAIAAAVVTDVQVATAGGSAVFNPIGCAFIRGV